MMKRLIVTALGVSYAIVFIVASFCAPIEINRLGNVERETCRLARQDRGSDGSSQRLFGCTGLSHEHANSRTARETNTSAKETTAPWKKKVDYPKNYLLVWTAKWCPKCPRMKVIGDKLKGEGFDVFYIDFDANKKKAKESNIAGIPVAIVYEDSEEVKRIIGVDKKTEKKVEAQIRKVLKKNGEEEEKEKAQKEPDNYEIY